MPERHRMLPASEDAERGVLASILIWPDEILARCVELGVTTEYFHSPSLGVIFGVLAGMGGERKAIDSVTLIQALYDQRVLDQVGGAASVSTLCNAVPTAANFGHYAAILREKWQLREVIRVGTEAACAAYDSQDEPERIVEALEAGALAIRARTERDEVQPPRDAVMEAIGAIEDLYERRGSVTGIPTGLADLDRLTDGLHGGEMFVIAARPSMGKTALAMNIAEHIGADLGRPVGVFSLEMGKAQLWRRLLCSRAKVDMGRVRDGFLSERDFPALTLAASKLAGSGLYIDDGSGMTVQMLRARARRMKRKYGIVALFVDYLQLLRSATRRGAENRQIEMTEVSGGLKDLSKELGIPVVVLAQLNRSPEKRAGGKPMLSDLRESGAIEQDADLVGLLVREEYYAETEEEKERAEGKATLTIAKQRNGPIGEVPLTFLKQFTRFETRATVAEEPREHWQK